MFFDDCTGLGTGLGAVLIGAENATEHTAKTSAMPIGMDFENVFHFCAKMVHPIVKTFFDISNIQENPSKNNVVFCILPFDECANQA